MWVFSRVAEKAYYIITKSVYECVTLLLISVAKGLAAFHDLPICRQSQKQSLNIADCSTNYSSDSQVEPVLASILPTMSQAQKSQDRKSKSLSHLV